MLKRFVFFLPFLVLAACAPDISDPAIQAAVIHTLTATVWTPVPPTPTVTPEPNTARIVDTLNNVMIGSDPLAETVEAKFSVMDARIIMDQNTHQAYSLRIMVDCEWVFSDSCTPESTFVALMRAFAANNKVIVKVKNQLPLTVKTMELLAFDRMEQTSLIIISLQDVMDFVEGKINGNQLGSRILRMAAMP